ncbi:LysM peptidoglycan-binding domain-containing protein [Paraglaciecola hydrolytica]|uniref:LysM domain-containing protein n=1 Tax=Paraglaciecola hydrolytica TaxID=1799789 RepID=A0A148KN48_9ALTE|nr:LysM peptidoglycan-binding domain-containing protein [Paraglaciecola hydrolytica]KXI27665.1 hypothetical protein AX660_19095 [Paraglaciecola hydrolytica]
MLRSLFLLSAIYLASACTTSPSTQTDKISPPKDTAQLNNVTLSHVRAYLLIGNIQKAEERFQTISNLELNPESLLTLAELRAAKGDILGAQQAFSLAINDPLFNKKQMSSGLLDYLCDHKKRQVLQGYAAGLTSDELSVSTKNQQLTTIGLCFVNEQQWSEARHWLSQIDLNKAVEPIVYLVLARFDVEQRQYDSAQQFMDKFEATRTKVDAQILWHTFEVYSLLQHQQQAEQAAQQLMILFPNTAFARKYLILTKRLKKNIQKTLNEPLEAPTPTRVQVKVHVIKKGETLYQLSKRYDVSVADLLKWNPTLVVNDIALGSVIRVSEQ